MKRITNLKAALHRWHRMPARLGVLVFGALALWTMAALVPSVALGAVPQLINFQGILKDGSGNPVADGSYSVIFTIYDAPVGGSVQWAETTSVSTTGGLFTVLLGALNPVPDSTFNFPNRYLGVKVGADPEMTPRQQLVSVGYAYESAQWTTAAQNLFRLNGNVGIGTTIPEAKLHVDTGDVFIGSIPTPPISPSENLYIANTIGDPKNSFRVDGWLNDLAIVASSAPGAATGTSVSFRTALAGGLETDRMRITSAGNVGIGWNNPMNKLDVEGGVAIGAAYSGTNVAPANGLLVEGNVGVGTAAPAARLHVHDASGTINGSRLTLTQTTTGTSILDGAALICTAPNFTFLWNYENGPSIFGTNNTERMRIDSVGNVGIGIDAPTAKLQVGLAGIEGTPPFIAGTQIVAQATNGGNWAHMAIISSSSGQSRLNFGDGLNDDQGSVAYDNFTDAMFLRTAAAERMRITSAGNVGIGTTSPNSRLQVNGALATAITAITTNSTLNETHSVVLASTPGVSDVVITLPTAVGIAGRQYTIKKADAAAHTVVVDANGAEIIDGAFLYNLAAQNKYVTLVSNGANWFVIANN